MLRSALAEPAPEWPSAQQQQPGDPCQGSFGELSGSFDTEWGSLNDVADVAFNGSEPLPGSAVVDGSAFSGSFRARAGQMASTRAPPAYASPLRRVTASISSSISACRSSRSNPDITPCTPSSPTPPPPDEPTPNDTAPDDAAPIEPPPIEPPAE
jgi:hypothetical protein